jgi:hypothetical protein
MLANTGGEGFGGDIIKCAIKIAKDFQGVLRGGFRDKTGHLPVITDKNNLFLIAFQIVQDTAEVAGHFGDSKRFHTGRLSDVI